MNKAREERLRASARLAVLAGTGAMVGTAFGQESAPAAAKADEKAVELDKVSVTGSRIRRVDTETASPVFVIDRATIERSGVTTLGELVQDLPSVAGAATNPRVNNGGGTGAAVTSLRGLGEQRTLVLLNGRRMTPFTNDTVEGVDINAIPINLIERVEILKEGASAIYGSDAIGGVVNFITRKDYSGLDVAYEYGESDRNDGKRQAVELSWGSTSARSNLMVGLNYNKQEEISAGDRKFSSQALYLYGGVVTIGGSSRSPTGRINLPEDVLADLYGGQPGCEDANSVTRIDGQSGAGTGDYRCFIIPTDFYNYQPLNLLLVPTERISLFGISDYAITDKVEAYSEIMINSTKGKAQLAALPLDTRNDNVVVSADSVYNPFGISFGGIDTGFENAQWRLLALGNRVQNFETTGAQVNLGLRGDLPVLTGWKWDVGGSWGRNHSREHTTGYLFTEDLAASFGPSFIDGDGAHCGTAGAIIDGCVPINIFNLEEGLADPAQAAAFDAAAAEYDIVKTRIQQIATVNLNGPLFQMPAGQAQLAVGYEFRKQSVNNEIDSLIAGDPATDFLTCRIQQETCTNPTEGSLIARELYAEMFLPLLADKEFAKTLNLILGVRYSDYSKFGDTTNAKAAVEYRPLEDLLLRGSYAEVFRAPTITDLYLAITSDAPVFNDPCTGLTAAQLAANPNLALACENVTPDGEFDGSNGQITGRFRGNEDLKPETGHVWTYGFVYDPNWLRGFSTTFDFFRYKLKNTIEPVDVNTTAAQCVQTGDPTFCDLIVRSSDGQVLYMDEPILNLGKIDMRGVDIGVKYRAPVLPVGKFVFTLDSTYYERFRRTTPNVAPVDAAGQFNRQDGNFARVRGLGTINWTLGPWESLVQARYVHGFTIKNADAVLPGIDLEVGSNTYWDFAFGYNIPGQKVKVQVGIENAFDKTPPLLFQNNVINANTDVETFDTIGRFFFTRVSVSF